MSDGQRAPCPKQYGAFEVLAALQDCVWVFDAAGVIEYMNGKAEALASGYAAPGRAWRDLWPEECRFSLDRAVSAAAAGQVSRFRAFLPTAERTRTYWDTVIAPIQDDGRSAPRLLATARDMTKEVETLAFLETVTQVLPSPLTVKNADDGRYVLINRAAEDAFGISSEECLGKTAFDLLAPADAERLVQAEAEVIRTGEMQVSENVVVADGGSTPRYFLTKRLATYDDVGPRHLIMLGEDMTERRSAAESLRSALAAAEQASLAKSAFLANMSHEIRTPLNGIVAGADMLANSDLGARGRELVEIILTSGKTLERLLSGVLDLARVEAGQVVIEEAPFHLGELARSVSALSGLSAEEKGVALRTRLDPVTDAMVGGDALKLRQVLVNLLSNAVKFTDHGQVTLEIAWRAEGIVRFCVSDTGVGFDAANKARIFERFQQADTSFTRRFGGSGLGLAISRQLVELMGGELLCDSSEGVGSSFWFELPLPLLEDQRVDDGDDGRVQAGRLALRVLAADDHPTNRKVVELMLAGQAEVLNVENGREAVEAFRPSAFDLILMDMQMPVMDGLAAVREIRRIEARAGRARVPIIMLTANARPEHVQASRLAGADFHLEKPITVSTLFSAIEDVLAAASPIAEDVGVGS